MESTGTVRPSQRASILKPPMVYRGAKPREAKRVRESRRSTREDKLRRHRNKERIWKRCVVRLALARGEPSRDANAAPSGAAFAS